MEGVFAIIRSDGTTLNMLREPGRLTSSIVDDWILALETGVPSFDPVSKLAKPKLPVCPYDKINMRWSGSAILNSCSEALKMDLKDLVPLSKQTGPKLFFHLLQKLYRTVLPSPRSEFSATIWKHSPSLRILQKMYRSFATMPPKLFEKSQ